MNQIKKLQTAVNEYWLYYKRHLESQNPDYEHLNSNYFKAIKSSNQCIDIILNLKKDLDYT